MKQPYRTPALVELGSVSALTLDKPSGTPGGPVDHKIGQQTDVGATLTRPGRGPR